MASGSIAKIVSVEYVDLFLVDQYVTANGMTAIVLNHAFPQQVLDVQITRAWPRTTWNGGALVGIVQWNYDASVESVSATLSTTSEQSYDITIRVFYES